MEKIKMFTKKVNRLNQTLITSFGNVEVDEEGFAEIDVKNQEQALEIGFEFIDPLKGNNDEEKELDPDEQLEISLFKETNKELKRMLAEAGVPEEEYKNKDKKTLVELILVKIN